MADEQDHCPSPLGEARHDAVEELASYSLEYLAGPGPHVWEDFALGLFSIVERYVYRSLSDEIMLYEGITRH